MLYGLFLLFLLAIAYAHWLEPRWLRVSEVDIPIPGLPPHLEGLTILHLSDLHQTRFGPLQERLGNIFQRHSYDLTVLTGDFLSFPAPYDFAPTAELLAHLVSPVYAVLGNHDYHYLEPLLADFNHWKVKVLHNSWLPTDWEDMQIAGVVDPFWTKIRPEDPHKTDLVQALAGTNPEKFTLLLSHSPGILSSAAASDIPLILCGHTHGGQIKIPLLGAPTTASGKLFDPYVQGIYRKEKTLIYINRGLGTSGLPLRFLSPPEVAFLRLLRA